MHSGEPSFDLKVDINYSMIRKQAIGLYAHPEVVGTTSESM